MVEKESAREKRGFLIKLRIAIPFLQEIPDDKFFNLDITEFILPTGELAKAREKLESLLKHHIMTYKRDVFNTDIPVEQHLCANIAEGHLTDHQLHLLEHYEKKYRDQNVNFVAYQKPLKLIIPLKSLMYQFYKKRGLL